MAYKNNHFVPRLVLRRYGDKINYYNLKSNKYFTNKNIENCFSQKKIYPIDVELKLGEIEGRFGDLLNNKILKADDELVLYRNELTLIKKFLMIEMFRVPDALVEHPESKHNPDFCSKLYGFEEKTIENESYSEYIFRTIRTIIDSNDIEDYLKNPDKTYEGAKWFLLFNSCYLTFWDSTESNEDFLITDRGMTCEHEKTRFAFEQYGFKEELIKKGYIFSKMRDMKLSKQQKKEYSNIMNLSSFVYANYYMFSISETRMIGLINPWYRLWFDQEKIKVFGSTPDVYPCMLSKQAMAVNRNDYVKQMVIDGISYYLKDDKDKYIYDIKYLQFEDVCLINAMMLDRTFEILGFVNSNKIIRSLTVYNNIKHGLNDFKGLQVILENLGYDFPKSKKYQMEADRITGINFTEEEQKYINVMFDLKNKINDFKNKKNNDII